jgi:hypothetical protein
MKNAVFWDVMLCDNYKIEEDEVSGTCDMNGREEERV